MTRGNKDAKLTKLSNTVKKAKAALKTAEKALTAHNKNKTKPVKKAVAKKTTPKKVAKKVVRLKKAA